MTRACPGEIDLKSADASRPSRVRRVAAAPARDAGKPSRAGGPMRRTMTRGVLGVGCWVAALSLYACAGEAPESSNHPADDAELGEAEQALETCYYGNPCDDGANDHSCANTCCPAQGTFGGVCRNLLTDPNNCGSCGNVCPVEPDSGIQFNCGAGHCCPTGKVWASGQCRWECQTDSNCAAEPSGATCCRPACDGAGRKACIPPVSGTCPRPAFCFGCSGGYDP
jgi:hypothetical protein